MWAPGHVGFWGNETADKNAEEPLNKEPTDDLMPFSDPEHLTAKYIHQPWQKEWDESVRVSSKLHEILPKISDTFFFFYNTRKEQSCNRYHIGHSYLTHSFILKKERNTKIKKSLLFVLLIILLSQSNISRLSLLI